MQVAVRCLLKSVLAFGLVCVPCQSMDEMTVLPIDLFVTKIVPYSSGRLNTMALVCKKFAEVANDCTYELAPHVACMLTDQRVTPFKNLRVFDVGPSVLLTSSFIATLTNLRSLSLKNNGSVTDAALASLTNLTSLDLSQNILLTDKALAHLTNLKSLNLFCNFMITDAGLAQLPSLVELNLEYNTTITDAGLVELRRKNPELRVLGR